jgi:hypothetical protein
MLRTIKSQFAHTHGTCIDVCKYHNNDNANCPSLKFVPMFHNVKFLCTNTNISRHFIITNKTWHTHTHTHHRHTHTHTPHTHTPTPTHTHTKENCKDIHSGLLNLFDTVWRTTHILPLRGFTQFWFRLLFYMECNRMTINTSIYTVSIINQKWVHLLSLSEISREWKNSYCYVWYSKVSLWY